MPRFRTLVAGLVAIACAGAAVQLCVWWGVEQISSQPDATTGPHLFLVSDDLDLGRIAPGDMAQATFVITNTGNQTLVFRQAMPRPSTTRSDSCCNPTLVGRQSSQIQ